MAGRLRGHTRGDITCRVGCTGIRFGSLGLALYQCTDFSVDEDWSTGEGSNEANLTGVTNFEAS